MTDFTLQAYRSIIEALLKHGYSFQTFADFLKKPKEKCIILRHDVDTKPNNSLQFALIQHELGIRGTYYFRNVSQSLDVAILKKISNLNHEIGYHYENMSACGGDFEKGKLDFEQNLKLFRSFTQVETICMHGSPISSIDNKELWKYINYKDYELIGEPYLDIDFSRIAYLTDTGRSWNGEKYNMRDSVIKNWAKELKINNSNELIQRIESGIFPKQAMLTFHPQRWTDNQLSWVKELILQTTKNKFKFILRKIRSTS